MSDTASAVILEPITITLGMLAAGTSIPVVDTGMGEAAWAVGTAYAIDASVNHLGGMWTAVAASTGVAPGTNATKWLYERPSNRMAPFDTQLYTQAQASGSLTYVIDAQFFTGLALYNLLGEHINIKVYDAPGGTLEFEHDEDLFEQAAGLFEYLFMPLRARTQMQFGDLPLMPAAQLHITITAAAGLVGVGLMVLGFWQSLLGASTFGGVEYGASTEIKSYAYVKTNDDGSVVNKPRFVANNVSFSVVIDADQANTAVALLRRIGSNPVALIASGLPKYDYLNTFGRVSAEVTADRFSTSKINITAQGYI